jgi:hypothetical protein
MDDFMVINGVFFFVNLCVWLWNQRCRTKLQEKSRDIKDMFNAAKIRDGVADTKLSDADKLLAVTEKREANISDLTEDFLSLQDNILTKMGQETIMIVGSLVRNYDPPITIDGITVTYNKRDLRKIDLCSVDDTATFDICDDFLVKIKSGDNMVDISYEDFVFDERAAVGSALQKLVDLSDDD